MVHVIDAIIAETLWDVPDSWKEFEMESPVSNQIDVLNDQTTEPSNANDYKAQIKILNIYIKQIEQKNRRLSRKLAQISKLFLEED